MGKIATRLEERVLAGPPETRVRLHVLLRRDAPPDALTRVGELVRTEHSDSDSCEEMPLIGGVICESTLGMVRQLEKMDEVQWIDEEHTAPLENLMDG
jgi:hypothetical protein